MDAGEDDLLLDILKKHNNYDWYHIAEEFNAVSSYKRDPKQRKQRYLNNLDTNVKKSEFTVEEDELIFKLHQQYGNKWSLIAKYIPGRYSESGAPDA